MTCIYTDRQESIQLYDVNRNNLEEHWKVWKLFREKIDTLKITLPTGKLFIHFGPEETEVFQTRRELHKELSHESGGTWIEKRGDKKKYFLDKGWVFSDIQQVERKEFFEAQKTSTFAQKATGIALGLLGIAPAVFESAQYFPRHVVSTEMALGFLALQQKNPGLALLGSYSLAQSVTPGMVNTEEFLINTYSSDPQTNPQVAPLLNGGFAVIWQSFRQNGSHWDIAGRLYDNSAFPKGPEFQINTYTLGNQTLPHIEALSDGGFVVVWESDGQDGDRGGLFGQSYTNSGQVAGVEIQINSYTTNIQNNPVSAAFSSGGFVVIWESYGQDGDLYGIFGQRFHNNGTTVGPEFLVNNKTLDSQFLPEVAVLPEDRFIVSWVDFSQDGNELDIHARLYNRSGTPLTPEFQVNTIALLRQYDPQITTLQDGNFVITWTGNTLPNGQDVYGQGYEGASGNPFDSEILIASGQDDQTNGRLATYGGNKFIAIWLGEVENGEDVSLFGQRFLNTGSHIGTQFQFSNYTNLQSPTVTGLSDEGFVVVWTSFSQLMDKNIIFGQRFDNLGNPKELQFQISTYDEGSQSFPVVQPLSHGGYVVVWQSFNEVSSYEIIGRCFDCNLPSNSSSFSSSPSHSTYSSSPHLTPSNQSSNFSSPPELNFSSSESLRSTHSPSPTLFTSRASSSYQIAPSTLDIPTITISYDISNPLYIGSLEIGTFTFTGGMGFIAGENDNVVTIELTEGYIPEDGQTITLFTVPDDQVDEWRSVTVVSNSACVEGQTYTAEGELVSKDDGTHDYQVIFETYSCSVGQSSQLAPLLMLQFKI